MRVYLSPAALRTQIEFCAIKIIADKMSDRILQLVATVAPSMEVVRNVQLAHCCARFSPERQHMVRVRFRALVTRSVTAVRRRPITCVCVYMLPNGRRDGPKIRYVKDVYITQRFFCDNVLHGFVVEWDYGMIDGIVSQRPIQSLTRYEHTMRYSRTHLFHDGHIRKHRSCDGVQTTWHSPRQMKSEFVRVNDQRHGKYESWYDNGQPEVQSIYCHGKLHGAYTKWYASGQICKQYTYVHGIKTGIYMKWHEDGRLHKHIKR